MALHKIFDFLCRKMKRSIIKKTPSRHKGKSQNLGGT